MAQEISQGNIFGRLGSALGKGLADKLPDEVDRGRLSAGIKKLSEQKDLTPFQQFGGLISLPGITPQGIQTGGQLLQQQSYLNALKNQYGEGGPNGGKGGYTPTAEDLAQPSKGEIPTLATPQATAESYKEYIPPTEQEERKDAFENFSKNPARYNNNFDLALNERKAITARNQEIQKAYQTTEATAVAKEGKVKDAFDKEAARLGINPRGDKPNFDPKLYQQFEEKLLNSVLSEKEGGKGLTQEQATKQISDDLLKAYQNYRDLSSLSVWSPQDFNRRIDAIQKNFEPFGIPAKNILMNKLIADYKVSPSYAAHKIYPIKKGSLPTLDTLEFGTKGLGTASGLPKKLNPITFEKLKNEMGTTKSPLSIAYELEQKGHDPRAFLKYLDDHRDNLEVWQADQLSKNINILDLRDMWLRTWE